MGNTSVTQLYCDRKNGREPVKYEFPILEDILKTTEGLLVYQEQILSIANKIAGFTLEQSDSLRKAVGVKDVELMSKTEKAFLAGCEKTGLVTQEEAKAIFEQIRKSQRYLFNKSHAVAYGTLGYLTAYIKSNFPLEFFCANLEGAKELQHPKEEIRALVDDAKQFNIEVKIPKLTDLSNETGFYIKDDKIYFGLSSIKGLGKAQLNNLINQIKEAELVLSKRLHEITWPEFLFNTNINKKVLSNLISVGLLDNFNLPRKRMLYKQSLTEQLSLREIDFLKGKCWNSFRQSIDTLRITPRSLGGPFSETRKTIIDDFKKALDNPPYDLTDDLRWIYEQEHELLGCAIACSKLDYRPSFGADTTCLEFSQGKTGKMIFEVEINDVREYTIKKGKSVGQKMGFLSVKDNTGSMNCMIFAENWENYKSILYTGNTVTICGKPSKDALSIEVAAEI